MDRKPYTIIFALILIASFFLPYFKGTNGSGSGLDIVTAKTYSDNWEVLLLKYIWILIPLSGVMLLIGALNNDNYFLGRGIWTWLPLLAVIYVIVRIYLSAKNSGMGSSVSLGDLIKIFGVGYWVAFGASLILAFYNPRSR